MRSRRRIAIVRLRPAHRSHRPPRQPIGQTIGTGTAPSLVGGKAAAPRQAEIGRAPAMRAGNAAGPRRPRIRNRLVVRHVVEPSRHLVDPSSRGRPVRPASGPGRLNGPGRLASDRANAQASSAATGSATKPAIRNAIAPARSAAAPASAAARTGPASAPPNSHARIGRPSHGARGTRMATGVTGPTPNGATAGIATGATAPTAVRTRSAARFRSPRSSGHVSAPGSRSGSTA